MQAREMIHNWDQQIVRLRHRVDELEEQNDELKDLLKDALRICDEAIATGHRSAPPSRFANMHRFLLFHSVSLRSLLQQQWRRLLLPVSHLPLPCRRDISPPVGWPFEPVLYRSTSVGSADTELRQRGTSRPWVLPDCKARALEEEFERAFKSAAKPKKSAI
jgi:hypothetical protein